ncbi:MAG TPA: uroporphyrinogen decarboxylase [bacterium]|jgi:uroporphyrinogen decarboxylase
MNDRFLRACRSEPVDTTPVWFMRQAGRSQPEYLALRQRHTLIEICMRPELCAEVSLSPLHDLGVDAVVMFADITLPLRSMGVAFELADGGPRIDRPVRTAEDVAAVGRFDIDELTGSVLEAIRLVRAASPVPVIGFSAAPFTLASYLIEGGPSREYAVTKQVMFGQPQIWAALMERLTDMAVRYLRAQIDAGIHVVQVFDSWVGCLHPEEYRRWVAPYSRRIFDALAAAGAPAIHFGTGTAGLLREMAAAGGDVIGIDWRIDLDAAWATIGPTRGIQGNLDPAALLAPEQVLGQRVEMILTQAAGRPGHIFNLGHGVLPQTDRIRLRMVVDRVHAARRLRSEEPV